MYLASNILVMSANVSDPRQRRGLVIAQSKRIKNIAGRNWYVPSQNSSGGYVVDIEGVTCSCPDHELRGLPGSGFKCKHIWAIEYVRKQVLSPDGNQVVVETNRVTYTQDWPKYNAYQCAEKGRVRTLLHELCQGIQMPPARGRGRPRKPLADVIYAAAMKTFTGFSGRRSSSEVAECLDMGFIDEAPAYNTVFEYLEKPEVTPLLQALVEESAAPIAAIDHETAFGIDATGFGTKVYKRWFDAKYGREMKEATWVKLHIAIGVRSKIVTAAKVTAGTLNDNPHLPGLVETTAERFKVNEVLADKGYVGLKNLEAIAKVGATSYIPFKDNNKPGGAELWNKAFHAFLFHRDEFLRHYGQRSNVEGVFSSIKRKFGPAVRAKKFDAQVNEVLLKVLCHNLSVLVRAIHLLDLDPKFWNQRPVPTLEDSE